jgi:hypothetical protein
MHIAPQHSFAAAVAHVAVNPLKRTAHCCAAEHWGARRVMPMSQTPWQQQLLAQNAHTSPLKTEPVLLLLIRVLPASILLSNSHSLTQRELGTLL